MLRGQAGPVRPDLVSTGPYMIEGADKVDASSCAALKPMRAASTADASSTSSATRTTTRRPTRRPRARACPTRSSSRQLERRRHLQQDRGGRARGRDLDASRRRCCASTRTSRSSDAPAPELGRPHLVPDDEPHPAAVRRRPRPPGDELGHGQDRARAGVGRAGDRQGREPHRPGHALQQPARRLRAVRDAGRPRQRREGEGGDEGSKYDTKGDGTCSAPRCKNVLLLADTRPSTRSWCR